MNWKKLVVPYCAAIFLYACNRDSVLMLHPENNHYFLFNDKPTLLVGSTEHYGAVLNLDFDYIRYLDELQRCGLNLTRTFTGIYVEPQGAFNIEKNTLAPAPQRLITPFARSSEPTYANGGNKFDLENWDEAYFDRLKDFISEAGKRGIIVEVTLFSSIYDEPQWRIDPQNPLNNINLLPGVPFKEVQTLVHPDYLVHQENMVKKIVDELNEFNNIYFEICNEPYADGVPEDWHNHMAKLVVQTEAKLPNKHLVSYNIANNYRYIDDLGSDYSMVNFHYAEPEAAHGNLHLGIPVGDNETGFEGTADMPYRTEAWSFILAGGALFNHLDYSFAVGHESGNFIYTPSQPGGGNATLREQFGFLRSFMEGHDLLKLRPDTMLIRSVKDQDLSMQVAEINLSYIGYFYKRSKASNENTSIRWTGDFLAPATGEYVFTTYSDDGIRLWIDKQLLIENWTGHSMEVDSGSIFLVTGEKAPLKIEYYNGLYGGSLKVTWQTLKGEETILDTRNTSLPGSEEKGLFAQYFDGTDFDDFIYSDTASSINFSIAELSIYNGRFSRLQTDFVVQLPGGTYTLNWHDPKTGRMISTREFEHAGGPMELQTPRFDMDILFEIQKQNARSYK
ncbi:MAG: PA14 domain-containing protein [Bacteroidota bacterium]